MLENVSDNAENSTYKVISSPSPIVDGKDLVSRRLKETLMDSSSSSSTMTMTATTAIKTRHDGSKRIKCEKHHKKVAAATAATAPTKYKESSISSSQSSSAKNSVGGAGGNHSDNSIIIYDSSSDEDAMIEIDDESQCFMKLEDSAVVMSYEDLRELYEKELGLNLNCYVCLERVDVEKLKAELKQQSIIKNQVMFIDMLKC